MSEISPLRPSPRLISCSGAGPVRTYRQPARAPGWLVRDPACFLRWRGSFARYDPGSGSWRTSQISFISGFQLYSQKWPRVGMLRDGECSELTIHWSAHRTAGRGGFVLRGWPTPDAGVFNYAESPESWDQRKQRHPNNGRILSVEVKRDTTGGRINPAWVEMLQGFPQGWTLTDGPPLRDHSTHGSHREPDQDSPTTETD